MLRGEIVKKILIAGTSSGVGKTTISMGIMNALRKRGMTVQPYKVGPDYIDPSYHSFITGRDSRNLDSYMLDDEKIKYIFENTSKGADISIIEGVMGLYDGLGTDIDNCTSSYTSKMLKSPVILVIDAKAMSSSAAAMVLGYKNIDENVEIKGVIANNVRTESHYFLVKESIEKYCGIEVIGYLPPNNEISLESRHLGLIPSVELESLQNKLDILSKDIETHIDLDRIIEIAESEEVKSNFDLLENIEKLGLEKLAKNKSIAVAYDKAFNFYYAENIELFKISGLEVKYFSPLKDREVPDANYIYIGGGFPEIYAEELGANKSMLKSILDKHKSNTPIYAECGGLMYLGESLKDSEDKEFKMVGIFKGYSEMSNRLKRFGYCYGIAEKDTVFSSKGDIIKGHEFHHSIFNSTEEPAYTMVKEKNGERVSEWSGGYSKNNTLATYLHMHFYNNLNCLKNFLIRGNI